MRVCCTEAGQRQTTETGEQKKRSSANDTKILPWVAALSLILFWISVETQRFETRPDDPTKPDSDSPQKDYYYPNKDWVDEDTPKVCAFDIRHHHTLAFRLNMIPRCKDKWYRVDDRGVQYELIFSDGKPLIALKPQMILVNLSKLTILLLKDALILPIPFQSSTRMVGVSPTEMIQHGRRWNFFLLQRARIAFTNPSRTSIIIWKGSNPALAKFQRLTERALLKRNRTQNLEKLEVEF